ncbi:MAG TPA: hypothetical protein DD714_03105 [Candidatus Omnitrophica bacterium]|nr:hypothetical protein [Candidatus Omnitrophota bacterium]
MNRNTFHDWLTGWLGTHPLRMPDATSPDYTKHVMTRIRRASEPKRSAFFESFASLTSWVVQPLPALVMGAVAALMIGVTLTQHHRGLRVVAEVGDEERWIEETLELLDEVEEVPEDPTGDSQAAEDVWQELQELDEAEWSLGSA